ncbi:canalicular multispecific organic anion transporter 2-like [Anopheles albimanus]|uniref:canalicular multispecific organic anion transporter 2-like n=1 Tax=Anopheles albimanus TaxID=7167 RepID=UPI001640AC74|nr:canalicular multispecific organic anion transporter 2-like [Anopheles albimanus]
MSETDFAVLVNHVVVYAMQYVLLYGFAWPELMYIHRHRGRLDQRNPHHPSGQTANPSSAHHWLTGTLHVTGVLAVCLAVCRVVYDSVGQWRSIIEVISLVIVFGLQMYSHRQQVDQVYLFSFWTLRLLALSMEITDRWDIYHILHTTLAICWLTICCLMILWRHTEPPEQLEPNLIRRLYFCWMDPVYREAQRSDCTFHEGRLSNALPDDRRCQALLDWFRHRTPSQQYVPPSEQVDRGLTITQLLQPFRKDILCSGLNRLVLVTFYFLCPYLLRVLLETNQSQKIQRWTVGCMFYTSLMIAILNTQYQHNTRDIGLRIKSILMGMIYESMTDRIPSKNCSSAVLTGDTSAFVMFMQDLHMLWSGPLIIIVTMSALYWEIGASAVVGLVLMGLTIWLTNFLSSKLSDLQKQVKHCQDARVRLTTEAIAHAQQIKTEQLESFFERRIGEHRTQELYYILRAIWFEATKQLLSIGTPTFVAFATFLFMELMGDASLLTVQSMFVAIALFNLTRYPMTMIPTLCTSWNSVNVSLERINVFIRAGNPPEVEIVEVPNGPARTSQERIRLVSQELTNLLVETDANNAPKALSIEQLNYCIGSKQILRDVSLEVANESFIALTGKEGAGKSMLLRAILGAIPDLTGKCTLRAARISYCSQVPWIQHDTIRNNILFGEPYHQERYGEVIRACCLVDDFSSFPDGDERIVGEGGQSLSGGQAHRVAIARAIYHRADLYLFDDPLRSLDTNIADELFERVFNRQSGLLAGKTCLFVSHNLDHIKRAADRIVRMSCGTIEQITDNLVRQTNTRQLQSKTESLPDVLLQPKQKPTLKRNKTITNMLQQPSTHPKQQTKWSKECNRQGSVPLELYRKFWSLFGYFWSVAVITLEILVTGLDIYITVLLAEWASTGQTKESRTLYLVALIVIVWSLFLFVKTGLLHVRGRTTSKLVHARMLATILRQPMEFFDRTDSGVIVNRFSNDLDTLDNKITGNARTVLAAFFGVLGTLGLFVYKLSSTGVLYTVLLMLGVAVLMCGLCYLLRYHLRVARTLKRFEASSRSPIVLQYNETVQGIDTIKAYGAEDRFRRQFIEKVDLHQSYVYESLAAGRWIGIRLEFVGVIIIYYVMLLTVSYRSLVGLAFVGIIVSYVLRLIPSLNTLLVQVGLLEENIISIERISQYMELPGESLDKGKIIFPQKGQRGAIEYRNFSLTHFDGSTVLQEISLTIRAGEKLGIIGRTGAGKSSLIGALFRFYPKHTSGAILIDGTELDKVSLNYLRGSLTLVPQNTTLFSGQVQSFVDPKNSHPAERIIETLRRCGLGRVTIGTALEELSVGERQLLCLVRGLLRDTPIIILDEATSAVDSATEAVILHVMREHFHDRTVLMIAHRLHTIQHCDRILWLANGRIRKLAAPSAYTDADWNALECGE